PECHCFGRLHSRPAGTETVVRNIVLSVPALLVVGHGSGPAIDAWLRAHDAQHVALTCTSAVSVVLAGFVAALWHENRRLRRTQAWTAPVPLRVGSRAPSFSLPRSGGGEVALDSLLEP